MPESRSNNFRFNARYALLTYSQSGALDPRSVIEHLESLGASCVVGSENHADEGVHLHAFVDFGVRYSTRQARVFDVGDCHPNILPGRRTPEKMYDYATKDGQFVASEGFERPGSHQNPKAQAWSEIESCDTRQDFIHSALRLDPRAAILGWGNLCKYADFRYAEPSLPYETPGGATFDTSSEPRIERWVLDCLQGFRPGVR